MKLICFTVLTLMISASVIVAQKNIIATGIILDSKTKLPLVSASIGLKGHPYSTSSDEQGNFTFLFPDAFLNDSLFISYVGYRTFSDKLSDLDLTGRIFKLEEVPTLLDEVTILEKRLYKFEIRRLESSLKLVKGNLYVFDSEVTNKEYNQFLGYLLQSNQKSLYLKFKPDISQYEGSMLTFFKGYHLQEAKSKDSHYDTDYGDYPVVNISHEAAIAYCEWFSGLYNGTKGKKKFSTIRFRLPTLKEWRIAALGYSKFQSWDVEENMVEVRIPRYPDDEGGVKKRIIPVKGNEIFYPWYTSYGLRNKPQNKRNCWLGNFMVPPGSALCPALPASGDGYPLTGRVRSYFPNSMGLYDVVGNVAEMIDEKGKACGGSWNHFPNESTIVSINTYSGASGAVGFRVFMEVIDEKDNKEQ